MTEYRVMVPLDGSKRAERALDYLDVVKPLGLSNLHLVSVVDRATDFTAAGLKGLFDYDFDRLMEYLRTKAAELHVKRGVEVTTRVVSGNAAAAIIEEAVGYAPDLLLIATHGRTGEARWRLGGVADKVVRQATCDTLVIPAAESPWSGRLVTVPEPEIRSVLVPVDGSSTSEQALEQGGRLAAAHLALLHVVTVIAWPAGESMHDPIAGALIRDREECGLEYLDRAVASLDRPGGVRTAVLWGSPAGRLLEYVEGNSIDIVVMARHRPTPFEYAHLGSVTHRMLGGPAPVFVIHPQQDLVQAGEVEE